MLSVVTRIPSPEPGVVDGDMISPKYIFLKILLQTLFPLSNSKWKLKKHNTAFMARILNLETLFSEKKKIQDNNPIK